MGDIPEPSLINRNLNKLKKQELSQPSLTFSCPLKMVMVIITDHSDSIGHRIIETQVQDT